MPVLAIVTNSTAEESSKDNFAVEATQAVAVALRIPKEHVHVHIQEGQFLSYGGNRSTPAAYMTVQASSRQILEESRKALVDKIVPLVQNTWGADSAHITTYFVDHPVENVVVGTHVMLFASPRSGSGTPSRFA